MTFALTHSSAQPPLTIVIISYNTADLLNDCLKSIESQLGPQDEIIVVDNASSDGSAEMVRHGHPKTRLVASEENLGFARGNNHALSIAKGEMIWLLNPDTRLQPGALNAAVDFMSRNPELGMAGTRLINPDGSPQSSVENRYPGQRYANPILGHLPGDIAWVMGASIVTPRHVMQKVGGFDERFFLYGEDVDLCLMVRKAGWPIGFIEESVVMHYGGESERAHTPVSVLEKKFTAEMYFYRKHYPESVIRRIKLKNRLQAAWRLLALAPQRWISPQDLTVMEKFNFYRLSWHFFKGR